MSIIINKIVNIMVDRQKRHKNIQLNENEYLGLIKKLINFDKIVTGYYGRDQSWFEIIQEDNIFTKKKKENAIMEGCGYVAIANCYAFFHYMKTQKSYDKNEFIDLMKEIYMYKTTLLTIGIISVNTFERIAKKYLHYKGYKLDIKLSGLKNKGEFIYSNIDLQKPVLLLFKVGIALPFVTHWVLVTEIHQVLEAGRIKDYIIAISSWGEKYYVRLSEIGRFSSVIGIEVVK